MSREKLAAMLTENDREGCIAFFEKLPEVDCKSYADQVAAWYKLVDKTPVIQLNQNSWSCNPLYAAADAAALASCSFHQIQTLGGGVTPEADVTMRILKARRPSWFDDWAVWFCERRPYRWDEVRRLIRDGLCRKPNTDDYVLGMIVGLCHFANNRRIYDELLDDEELLEEDVWRLFEIEGNGERTLAARDKYSRGDNNWTHAFLQLSRDGKLSRDRLLDVSLAALKRDFSQFRAGWFSQFHEAMEPTLDERAQRVADYLDLLGSRIPPTVSFALKALQTLEKEHKIEPQALLEAIGPTFSSKSKGTASAALKLVEKTLGKHPGFHGVAGPIVVVALDHESPDVQMKALDLIEKWCTPLADDSIAMLRERSASLAASQRPRLKKLLESTPQTIADDPKAPTNSPWEERAKDLRTRAAKVPKALRTAISLDALFAALKKDAADVPAIDLDFFAIPQLDPTQRLSPITSLNELVDAYVRVLEDPSDPLKVELVLDGVSRLCDQKPSDFATLTGPVRKRAMDRLAKSFSGPFIGAGVLADLCGMARAWLCQEVVLPKTAKKVVGERTLRISSYDNGKNEVEFFVYYRPTVRTFLSKRALEVACRSSRGEAAPLLAMPTHVGGWIDALGLVERALELEATKRSAEPLDQIQSLLRLAPDGRAGARKAAQKVGGEFGCALRYALGGDEKIGANASLWAAAARTRQPADDDARLERKHPKLGPDAAMAARYRVGNKKRYAIKRLDIQVEPETISESSVQLVAVLMNPDPKERGELDNIEVRPSIADIRWMASIWPARRESWFAKAVIPIADNLDWWEAQWENRAYLEPLLERDFALAPMSRLALAFGLAAKNSDESGLAIDALIAAIDDGRLDATGFGAALALAAATGLVKLSRWARTLAIAARVSPLHRHIVLLSIQSLFAGDPRQPPKDLHAILAVLKEGLIEQGGAVDDLAIRSFLENTPAAGKSARLIREILKLEHRESSEYREALLRAIEQRLERVEAWRKRVDPR